MRSFLSLNSPGRSVVDHLRLAFRFQAIVDWNLTSDFAKSYKRSTELQQSWPELKSAGSQPRLRHGCSVKLSGGPGYSFINYMKPLRSLLAGAALALAFDSAAADPKPLDSQKQKASYGVGMNVGKSFKSDLIDLDIDAFITGFKDGLAGKESAVSAADMEKAMTEMRADVTKKTDERMAVNKKAGEEFLAKNKTATKNLKTTESGLQYVVEKEGTGPMPKATDTVKVHYRGTLIDGTEFDSSYKRNEPAVFPVNGVIRGWTEILQLMKVGSKYKVFIPSDLAYGDQGQPPVIPPAALLIFEIELLGIEKEEG